MFSLALLYLHANNATWQKMSLDTKGEMIPQHVPERRDLLGIAMRRGDSVTSGEGSCVQEHH